MITPDELRDTLRRLGYYVSADQSSTDPRGAALLCDISERTLESWRQRGEGPNGYRFGGRYRYRFRDIAQWMNANSLHESP